MLSSSTALFNRFNTKSIDLTTCRVNHSGTTNSTFQFEYNGWKGMAIQCIPPNNPRMVQAFIGLFFHIKYGKTNLVFYFGCGSISESCGWWKKWKTKNKNKRKICVDVFQIKSGNRYSFGTNDLLETILNDQLKMRRIRATAKQKEMGQQQF